MENDCVEKKEEENELNHEWPSYLLKLIHFLLYGFHASSISSISSSFSIDILIF